MARTEITVRTITSNGLSPAPPPAGDVTNGNVVKGNNGRIWLEVKNTSTTVAHTLTVVTPGTVDGNPISDRVYNLAIGAEMRIGPLSQHAYGSNIEFNVNNTAVTVAAYQLSL